MGELRIPTIDEIIGHDAYEARMHFLMPNGEYRIQPGMVVEPTTAAAQCELPKRFYDGVLMWVDFKKPEVIGVVGDRYATVSRPIGEPAVAVTLKELKSYSTVQAAARLTDYTRFWFDYYASDRSRDNLGILRHPTEAIAKLHPLLDEQPKGKKDKAYFMRLARLAFKDSEQVDVWERDIRAVG